MRRPSILAPGAAIVLVVAACSSGGGSGGTGAPAGSAATAAPGGYGVGDGRGGYGSTDASASAPAAGDASGVCAPSTAAGTLQVGIERRSFDPSTVEAKVGDVIAFTNSDSVPHTATLDDASCTTPTLGAGATGALVFSAAGSYPFHCKIHADMTGTFEITG